MPPLRQTWWDRGCIFLWVWWLCVATIQGLPHSWGSPAPSCQTAWLAPISLEAGWLGMTWACRQGTLGKVRRPPPFPVAHRTLSPKPAGSGTRRPRAMPGNFSALPGEAVPFPSAAAAEMFAEGGSGAVHGQPCRHQLHSRLAGWLHGWLRPWEGKC